MYIARVVFYIAKIAVCFLHTAAFAFRPLTKPDRHCIKFAASLLKQYRKDIRRTKCGFAKGKTTERILNKTNRSAVLLIMFHIVNNANV